MLSSWAHRPSRCGRQWEAFRYSSRARCAESSTCSVLHWYASEVSHMQYRHADGRGTTVPNHGGRDISPILLRQIARDIGMTAEEFINSR